LGPEQLDYYTQFYQKKTAARRIVGKSFLTYILDKPELQRQKIRFEDLDIWFPHAIYPCQREYMAKALEAVKRGQNAMLESPTGTGKTISLLCVLSAYMKRLQE
jgi:regulator of telomere elongation helicase 1